MSDRAVVGYFDWGTPNQPDRVEIVRYDRAGKYYVEYLDRVGRTGKPERTLKSIREAAETLAEALWLDNAPGKWNRKKQFVNRFDKEMERLATQMGRAA